MPNDLVVKLYRAVPLTLQFCTSWQPFNKEIGLLIAAKQSAVGAEPVEG